MPYATAYKSISTRLKRKRGTKAPLRIDLNAAPYGLVAARAEHGDVKRTRWQKSQNR